ncbi:phosphotransferase [Cognatiyoonia sp. IB215446]|nr:phosphotransferase [Cognatiyoonia sp. IB215446]
MHADQTENGSAALASKWKFGPGGEVFTTATTAAGEALLENEARALRLLDGDVAPRFVSLARSAEGLTLTRSYVPGPTLTEVPLSEWMELLSDFRQKLQVVHDAGLIHGDIKSSNFVVTNRGLVIIDWEHAMPIGTDLASWPHRPASLGTSAPDMIWGRGQAIPELDYYSLNRLEEQCAGAREES